MTHHQRVALALSAVGLAVSVYLTVVHYSQGQVPLLCAMAGAINCERVTTSPESSIGPLPVASLGVIWFLGILVLELLRGDAGHGLGSPMGRLVWSVGGLLVVLYLIYAELFLIGAICLWCSVVHLVVFVLFLTMVNDVSAETVS